MKKLARIAAGLVAATAVASAGALAATAGPASATTGTAYFSTNHVIYGQSLTIHGNSSATAGKAYLYAKPYKGSWHVVATDTSPSTFSWKVKPPKYTQYRVRVVDTAQPDDVATAPHPIGVSRKVTRPALHPKKRTISGKVGPAYKKRLVTIQKRRCSSCAWTRAKIVRTNKWSNWHLRIPVKKMQYRAVVKASNGFSKTGSKILAVKVVHYRPIVG